MALTGRLNMQDLGLFLVRAPHACCPSNQADILDPGSNHVRGTYSIRVHLRTFYSSQGLAMSIQSDLRPVDKHSWPQ